MKVSFRSTSWEYSVSYLLEKSILAMVFFLPISLNATSLFMACGTLLWLVKMGVTRKMGLRRSPFDLAIFLFAVLSAASIYMSPDKGFSFYNYYHLMGRYILIYYLVVNNIHSIRQVKAVVTTLLISAACVAAYGFYQYFHGVDMAFEWVDGEQFPGLKVRVFSTLENPNLLAGFLVIIMAIAGGLALHADRMRDRLILAMLIIALGACLAFTYSRGAWLSVLAIIFTFGLLYSRKIFWLLALVPVIIFVAHDVLISRLMSIMNPTDTSSTLRLALWESTIAMIKDHPFLGIGWGAYWLVYPEYDFFVQDAATKIFHAHNMYLNIAAEIGIPGFCLFMAIFFGHAGKAYALARGQADNWSSGLAMGVFAAFAGIAVSGFTDYVLFNIQLSMLFWLLNALIICVFLNYGTNKLPFLQDIIYSSRIRENKRE